MHSSLSNGLPVLDKASCGKLPVYQAEMVQRITWKRMKENGPVTGNAHCGT